MDKKESVIITGGQGFIGSWVAKLLLDDQKYNVVVVDVKPDLHILKQIMSDSDIKLLEFVYVDIADTKSVSELVLRVRPSFIVHLAGLQIPTCKVNPILGASVNVIGTLNVFEAVRQLQATKQQSCCCPVIYASSAAVSGPSEDYDSSAPVSDDAHHAPVTHYGVFKQANEGAARVYWLDHKIPSVALRPFTVYGVGREVGMTSAPTKAIKAMVLGQDYVIPFSGDICINYVEDIARLFINLGQSPNVQGAYTCNIKGDTLDVLNYRIPLTLVKKHFDIIYPPIAKLPDVLSTIITFKGTTQIGIYMGGSHQL
ncbi:hypothetical protein PPL_03731 [Heterostelium album PN500]|uniref:NAD-dependent epimerase/dehydratase domain-containing protein n=1 Tax=Heterostelium pallidum (strain ATCC 26659 / Pp 5 / PN500) TaxID=670386 RepID=D3B6I3_HETP5|nr:hypothetical protein PPL_03731 [Heterostelium album PN500]EFA82953.1 hypothetical protein PPL_03731 [Heterostelium album PN500]|eukprot:XP_020435070.1 hypothetical protein PPL_03731 [Heterostelium album PN500]